MANENFKYDNTMSPIVMDPTTALDPPIAEVDVPEVEERGRGFVIAAFSDSDIRKVRNTKKDTRGAYLIVDGPEDLARNFTIQQIDAATSNGLKVAVLPGRTIEESAQRLWDYFVSVAVDHASMHLHEHKYVKIQDKLGNARAHFHRDMDTRRARRVAIDMTRGSNINMMRKLAATSKGKILELMSYDRFVGDAEMGEACQAAGITQKSRNGLAMYRYFFDELKRLRLIEVEGEK